MVLEQDKLSIVSTVYNSKEYLEIFISKCIDALAQISCTDFEFVFINDGSPDDSLDFLLNKKKKIPQITILDLSRNFGHHYAAVAGLHYAKGGHVFLADCDLEVSPEILVDFYRVMAKENADVVYGFQEKRKGKFLEKFFGSIFWKGLNYFSDIEIPKNIVTERLMTQRYVEKLLSLGDRNLFLGGMMYWTGFNQIGVAVSKSLRKEQSTYSTMKRLKLLLDAITSFTTFPLKLLFYFGGLLSAVSFSWGAILVFQKLMHPESYLSGYVSMILVVVFFSGVIEISLGVLGLYLGKVFKQVQSRPLYIVKDIY